MKRNSKMFTEKVEINQEKLIITISCAYRSSAIDLKKTYNGDINLLIPLEVADRVTLLEAPLKPISNVRKPSFSNIGIWIFGITPKASPRKKPRKTSTRAQSHDTIETE